MEFWEFSAWFSWLIPIAGALLTPAISKLGRRARDYVAVAFSGIPVALTVPLIPLLFAGTKWPLVSRVQWVTAGGLSLLSRLEAGVIVDPLSVVMANVVSVIGFLIMVYSLGYMKGEEGLTRYWFFMNFFIGNMLLLVFSENFIQMLFGWEGVGLCSYALIGFWYRDSKKDWLKCWVGEPPEAYPPSHCGLKAFLMTRFGDCFMIAGVLIVLAVTGTTSFADLYRYTPRGVAPWLLLLALLLILCGAIGKSAQLPLMEWLPDAMAGPTTVSALIHAATMVKAGVYLVARVFPIAYVWALSYREVSGFFVTVLWVGTLTAFVAATQAVASSELKKVLAYSTVSQLGYMMMALGAGGLAAQYVIGYAGCIYHLISHALFKAALFLGAGAVLHAVGSRFFRHFGGLRRHMPITFISMLLAACSLMGVPVLFSGFWSKDMVLEGTLVAGQYAAYALGVVTAALTAFYTTRMLALTFLGSESEYARSRRVHEAPAVMWAPVAALVAATIAFGVSGMYVRHSLTRLFGSYLASLMNTGGLETGGEVCETATVVLSLAAVAIGAGLAYASYVLKRPDPRRVVSSSRLFRALWTFLFRRWYINTLYYKAIAEPTATLGRRLALCVEPAFARVHTATAMGIRTACRRLRRVYPGLLNYNMLLYILGLLILTIVVLSSGW